MVTPASELAIWNGAPIDVFPRGAHVFPADLDTLRELVDVLHEDLRETHDVSVELVRRAQQEDFDAADAPGLAPSFTLRRLRDFLSKRRPAFDRAAHRRIVDNTARHGRARIEQLRSLGANEMVIELARTELARVERPDWTPTVDVGALLPSAVAVASNVDIESRGADELFVDADITALVLLAVQCCTSPGANALGDEAWFDDLGWTPLAELELEGESERDSPPIPSDVVRVGVSVSDEHVERLAFAIVPAAHVGGVNARALLAVSVPDFEE